MWFQQRFSSACTFTQSDQNLHWRILDSLGCKVSHADNEDWLDGIDAQADLSLLWAYLSEGMFSHVEAYTIWINITKTRLFKYIENFASKNWKFSDKNSDTFHISAQNIDWGYPLEPPRRGGSNEYLQSMFLSRNKKNNVNPSFTT